MNLSRKNLFLSFVTTLFFQLTLPSLFPSLKLKFFIPFLILVYYQKEFLGAVWFSLFCGIILDLLSAPAKFGLYSLTYTLTTMLLYGQRLNLFADNVVTLPIMTFLFSVISTLLEFSLLYIFGKPVGLSIAWLFSELLFMPLADTLYSFILFIVPAFMFGQRSSYTR